jgi:hypothetical protein
MKLSKVIVLSLGLIVARNTVFAQSSQTTVVTQDYRNAIGLRLGGLSSGLTFKHFAKPLGAFEGILSFAHRSFIITGLYEQHVNIGSSPGLRWFYGGGAHIGFFRYNGYYYWGHKNGKYYYADPYGRDSRAIVGLDLILGLDYKFANAPFNLSLDIKPIIDFYDGPYMYFDGALSVRFTF